MLELVYRADLKSAAPKGLVGSSPTPGTRSHQASGVRRQQEPVPGAYRRPVRSSLFLLTGFPGVGKLTVARAMADSLERDGETVRIAHNHWINNVIFGLIAQDGITPLPSGAWDRVGEVWDAVIQTVEELTPHSWHVIFTAYLDGVTDTGFVPRLEEVAERRGSRFIVTRLLCEPVENARRIVSSERRELMKSVDPEEPFRLATQGPPYDPGHASTVTLDITDMPSAESAAKILELARTA